MKLTSWSMIHDHNFVGQPPSQPSLNHGKVTARRMVSSVVLNWRAISRMLPWSPYSKSTKMAEEVKDLKNSDDKSKDKQEKQEDANDAKPVEKVTESSEGQKTPKKTPKKTPAKSSSKDAKAKAKSPKKKESTDEEDDSDDNELVGILDQPLVIAGKRDRKSTDFLVNTFKPQGSEKKKLDIPQGKGDTLASMPRVQFQLTRIVADELKPLHRLLFGRAGANSEVKRNIRNFNGFDFEKDSKDYQKKLELVDRFTLDSLKRLCEILDVEKKGKKDDMLDRVMDFLMKPKASGNPLTESKKKTPKKSETKRKRSTKENKSSSKNEVEEGSGSEDEEEEEKKEEQPPRKKKKVSADEEKKEKKEKKEKPGKKESKSSTKKDKKVVSIKISPGKKGKKEKAKKKADSKESSDDEPLIKKSKKSPPTNDDIVDLVKDLLDGADLEKITMKTVCKQVYERFPDFDLTDRKEFIKETVKEIIT